MGAIEGQDRQRENVVRLLAAATFLVFFQAYMVAPILPGLCAVFRTSVERVGLIVPAYLIPYGVSTLGYGILSDRIGRRGVILGSLAAFIGLTALTASAQSLGQLLAWRLLTGLGASGVVPMSLALMGQLFPYERRGRPLGWLFGAMAGGMAFGSTFGAVLVPVLGWRGLFVSVAGLGLVPLVALIRMRGVLGEPPRGPTPALSQVARGFGSLLASERGSRTYALVLVNAIFHSGVFTWLGVYFEERFALGEVGIGLALLGYGVPGFLFGPVIGRAADRWGRRWLIPAGVALAALAAASLVAHLPLVAAGIAVTLLSLGYDLTQPLLAGIVTTLDPKRGGQAMGLNVFALFCGFGVGSLAFGALLPLGLSTALGVFALVQVVAAVLAVPLFASEGPTKKPIAPAPTRAPVG